MPKDTYIMTVQRPGKKLDTRVYSGRRKICKVLLRLAIRHLQVEQPLFSENSLELHATNKVKHWKYQLMRKGRVEFEVLDSATTTAIVTVSENN